MFVLQNQLNYLEKTLCSAVLKVLNLELKVKGRTRCTDYTVEVDS